MPALQQRLVLIAARDALAFVRFELKLSLATDVTQMRRHGADLGATAGDLDHDFRCPSHRARDLLNLGPTEMTGRLWALAAGAEDLKERRPSRWKPDGPSSQASSPSSRVPRVLDRVCAAPGPPPVLLCG